jgi:hypothetical protein
LAVVQVDRDAATGFSGLTGVDYGLTGEDYGHAVVDYGHAGEDYGHAVVDYGTDKKSPYAGANCL